MSQSSGAFIFRSELARQNKTSLLRKFRDNLVPISRLSHCIIGRSVRTTFAFLRYSRHIKRLFTGQGTLQSAAYRQEILCPEEKATYRPAVYLDGQLERVTNSPVESTKEMEIDSATKLTGRHAATIAYHFKDVAM